MMNTATKTKPAICQGKSSLQRPNYASGLLLEDEDLSAAVAYTRGAMRLMLRSLFGCGVVCGLKVTAELICHGSVLKYTVAKGVALDCAGDLIHVTEERSCELDPDCAPFDPTLYVTLCYTETTCRPRDISCSPGDDAQIVQTRIQEGWEIKLSKTQPPCACSCLPAPPPGTLPPGSLSDCGCGGGNPAAVEERRRAEALANAPASPTEQGAAAETPKDNCACYKGHNDGVCECVCNCTCVLIAVIDTTKVLNAAAADADPTVPRQLDVDSSMRRLNRPVLVGYLPCINKPAPTTSA